MTTTTSTDLLARLRAVTAAVSAGERAAGADVADLLTDLEEQVTSGALVYAWDATVTDRAGNPVEATVTSDGGRVLVEFDATATAPIVEEAGGAFAIDLGALAAKPQPGPALPPAPPPGAPTPPAGGGLTVDLSTAFYPSDLHGATLASTRAWLAARKVTGADCPACGQFAKIYTRKMNSGQARSLIKMYRAGGPAGTGWVHLPSKVGSTSREEGKLKHWGLVESQTQVMGKDGHRGVWRLTPDGVDFVLGEGTVPQAIRMYAAECLGTTGPQITILNVIATDFNYDDVMRGLVA
ncbi:MAG: hypothetical protein ACOH1Y_15830 [Propionicimonas sp.]